jgi:hypothetical protein
MAQLPETAKQVRKTIMDQVLREGFAPRRAQIREKHGLTEEELDRVFKDLEAAVIIAVQKKSHAGLKQFQGEPLEEGVPEPGEIFYARGFANFKNTFKVWVEGEQKWYGECSLECCMISAMFPGKDVIVRTVCRQTKEPVELIERDGEILETSPRTLRVHIGYPVRYVPDDILGWCDYNSFFSSEEAVAEWRKSHPNIKGVTRDPRTICNFGKLLTGGSQRLHYDFQMQFPILKILWNLKKIGFTKPAPALGGLHLPDPFMMMTPHFFKEWKRQGYRNYARFSLL